MNADAVKAAAEALLRTGSLPLHMGEIRYAAEAAVAAAEPIIRAAIAAEIRRGLDGRTGPCVQAWDEALRRAARIAEGES